MGSLKRKSTDDTAAEPLPPPKQKHRESDSPLPSANNDEEPVACLHDVSYPEGYVPPHSPSSSASAPAKEFPFTLDSFQSESINCLESFTCRFVLICVL
nr:dexh-box atp-dependent rna helicase dexh9 [Quercus suber]